MAKGLVHINVKKLFFDRAAVVRAIDKATRANMARGGRLIRMIAQQDFLPYRKGPSAPGSHPHSHKESGALLRKRLWFSYDPASRGVVIGPEGLRNSTVPNVVEFGGSSRVGKRGAVLRTGPGGRLGRGKNFGGRAVRLAPGEQVNIAARPFMGPALAKAAPMLPEIWRNSVVRGN